jgi:hypothetical protein
MPPYQADRPSGVVTGRRIAVDASWSRQLVEERTVVAMFYRDFPIDVRPG